MIDEKISYISAIFFMYKNKLIKIYHVNSKRSHKLIIKETFPGEANFPKKKPRCGHIALSLSSFAKISPLYETFEQVAIKPQ